MGLGASPYAKLEVHDGVTSTTLSDPIAIFSGTSYTANGLYGIGFHLFRRWVKSVFIGYDLTAGAGNTKGNLVFGTRDTTRWRRAEQANGYRQRWAVVGGDDKCFQKCRQIVWQ